MSTVRDRGGKGNLRDVLAGLFLFGVGGAIGLYVLTHYDLGRIERMGPGMFPVGVSAILAFLGAVTIVSGLNAPRQEGWAEIDYKTVAVIVAAMALFAILFPLLGAIPAIIGLSVMSGLAIKRGPLEIVGLAAALCAMAYFIFQIGLGIQFPLFRWF